jgi:DNA-binding CsgD family transcriptional regulator
MGHKAFNTLTERQKECLLLVFTHHTISEIASKIGLSVEGVNYHLGGARRTLGASSSGQAARMAYGDFSPADYISPVAAPNAVASGAQPGSLCGSLDQQAAPPVVREDRSIFQPVLEHDDPPGPPPEAMNRWKRPASILGQIANRTSQIAGVILMLLALTYAVTICVRWYAASHHISLK